MTEHRERRCRTRQCGVPVPGLRIPLCVSCRACWKMGLASGGLLAFLLGLAWSAWRAS